MTFTIDLNALCQFVTACVGLLLAFVGCFGAVTEGTDKNGNVSASMLLAIVGLLGLALFAAGVAA